MNHENDCPDCGVSPGKTHLHGCDIEQCLHCGWQALTCECKYSSMNRSKWTGLPFTVDACRKLGWYAKFNPKHGWVSCDPDDDGATEDVNRLYRETTWDKGKQKFIRRFNGSKS
jgi:hypothetical protein